MAGPWGEKTLLASPRRALIPFSVLEFDAILLSSTNVRQGGGKRRLNDVSQCSSFHGIPSFFISHRSNFESWIEGGKKDARVSG